MGTSRTRGIYIILFIFYNSISTVLSPTDVCVQQFLLYDKRRWQPSSLFPYKKKWRFTEVFTFFFCIFFVPFFYHLKWHHSILQHMAGSSWRKGHKKCNILFPTRTENLIGLFWVGRFRKKYEESHNWLLWVALKYFRKLALPLKGLCRRNAEIQDT